jgi:hypothetical protein
MLAFTPVIPSLIPPHIDMKKNIEDIRILFAIMLLPVELTFVVHQYLRLLLTLSFMNLYTLWDFKESPKGVNVIFIFAIHP